MCLITFALKQHPTYPLIIAANRDEFFERPTQFANFWPEYNDPQLLAGKDLRGGGTWLGITNKGELAALTNFRESGTDNINAPSRGLLPLHYLTIAHATFWKQLNNEKQQYEGFNLIAGNANDLNYYSNRAQHQPQKLTPGVYSLSNGLINSDWPKVNSSRYELEKIIQNTAATSIDALCEPLFTMLRDNTVTHQGLPDTGVPLELEQQLSSRFIQHPDLTHYGTRCSTLIFFNQSGQIDFHEKSFDAQGAETEMVHHQLQTSK